jgi:hypothetical protein
MGKLWVLLAQFGFVHAVSEQIKNERNPNSSTLYAGSAATCCRINRYAFEQRIHVCHLSAFWKHTPRTRADDNIGLHFSILRLSTDHSPNPPVCRSASPTAMAHVIATLSERKPVRIGMRSRTSAAA